MHVRYASNPCKSHVLGDFGPGRNFTQRFSWSIFVLCSVCGIDFSPQVIPASGFPGRFPCGAWFVICCSSGHRVSSSYCRLGSIPRLPALAPDPEIPPSRFRRPVGIRTVLKLRADDEFENTFLPHDLSPELEHIATTLYWRKGEG